MGRGRAKAKQTKVARELKYRSVETDFASLQRELRNGSGSYVDADDRTELLAEDDFEDDVDDEYGDLAARYDIYDEDDDDEEFRATS